MAEGAVNSPRTLPAATRALAGGLALFGLVLCCVRCPGRPVPTLLPAQSPEQRLRDDVEVLAGAIGPRDLARHPEALRLAAGHVVSRLRAAGYEARRLPFAVGEARVENLEATLRGRELPGEAVVLCARYDTVPDSPGADDDASGVAVLLEVARALARRPARRTLRVVAFVNEEPPHFQAESMGSLVYARDAAGQGQRVIAAVALDMLGSYGPAPRALPAELAALAPELARGDFLALVGDPEARSLSEHLSASFARASPLPPLRALLAPRTVAVVGWSDHWSFWQVGVPALMVTDTAFVRTEHYHRPTDTPERLDYPRLAQASAGIARAVWDLAEEGLAR
ncbi:MAG: M28 family peptidase [Planctomycetota bacterium]